jgi:hypothetical protein
LVAADRVEHELRASKQAISDQLGECESLSVPKGAYNRAVFDAARDADYAYILTSEPERLNRTAFQRPIGRWNIWHDTDQAKVEKILFGNPKYYLQTIGRWKTLKMVKRLIGRDRFVAIRDRVLG